VQQPIDFGNEPPLSVDGEDGGLVSRRRVSIHWLIGTILTAVSGTALMGGAVFASLDGQTNFASLPDRFEGMLRSGLGAGDRATVRKADRLPTYTEAKVSRHVIRISTAAKVGNREIMQVKPFTRVAGNLSLSVSDISAKIPPFNPQRLLAESASDEAAPATDSASAAAPDAAVSFVTHDLNPLLPHAHVALTTPVDQIVASVREAANAAPHRTGVQSLGGTRLAYAAEANSDPYAGFTARIIPENVTLLPKTTRQTTGGNPWNERVVPVKAGNTVPALLQGLGATAEDANAVAARLGPLGKPGGLKGGEKLRVLLSPVDGGRYLKPVRVVVANDEAVEAVVAFSDAGRYVSVDVQSANTEMAQTSNDDDDDDRAGVRLYQSIYETALGDQVPRSVVDDLIRIYSFDVDFQRRVQPGDSFEVLYSGDDDAPDAGGKSDVVFASLTLGGETKKFYRFQTPDDGIIDYYDEAGKSAKKFLVRKPVGQGIMRSGFGFRRHPILGYVKMHTGVDWAAPNGTPIYAAGNGVVEKVGWESGYGKYIRLRHSNGYETAYGHMTAFAKNISEGTHVHQGQVIGFVGSTGLSTGAHLHFEILVNGRFVDPMRIKLPRGRALAGDILKNFEKERARIDDIINRAPMQTAQTTAR
jgi:murein DD-endopeptidase MepM/ murein hydrolase activator NlpD